MILTPSANTARFGERLTDATHADRLQSDCTIWYHWTHLGSTGDPNSLYQRRKEFAMLRSVGLDRKGLDRLLHIEGFFLGGKPLVIGLPILFLIAAVLMWMNYCDFYGVHSGISVITMPDINSIFILIGIKSKRPDLCHMISAISKSPHFLSLWLF